MAIKRAKLSFLFLIIFCGCSFAENVTRLNNGVKIITQSLDSEIITLDVWIKAGSRNETPQISGISHFIEHLLFKGSQKYKTGEMDRLIEESGGVFNAATSKDFTHFYIVIPREYFNKAAEIMGDMIANPLFPPEEIEKERLVVLEEIYRSQSQPQNELYNLLYEKSFRYHPYYMPVLGSLASISYLGRDTLVKYYQTFYAGENVSIVAAGKLPNNSAAVLKKEFSNIPRLAVKSFYPQQETISDNKLFEQKKEISRAYLSIAFSSPAASSFDSYVMDLIITILGKGRNCRLNREVKENSRLVYNIDISYPTPIDPGLVMIDAVCDTKNISRATQKIFDEINRLRTEAVSGYELKKAKNMLEVDNKIAHSSPQQLASELGYFSTVADTDYAKNYMENIKKISEDDIKKTADKYFAYYTIARFIPK